MKKIAIWNNYVELNRNKMFDEKSYGIGEDLGAPIIMLKQELEALGYIVETLDMDDAENYEKIIFLDYPNPKTCCTDIEKIPVERKYLILTECEMVYRQNAMPELYVNFNKVFTYDDALVKRNGFIKLNISNKLKEPLSIPFSEKKFSTVIAGNKVSKQEGELYSERLQAIRFMEKNHPEQFDLYGIGWNAKTFTGKITRVFNVFPPFRKIFAEKFKCYKGKIGKKLATLSQYKFCFCYENCNNIPGYISEKIWDCLFAGCIPVYLGAPNIENYFPENVFIDKRKFSSYESLYDFLTGISEEQYNEYLNNIKSFISSSAAYPFSAECFIDTLKKELFAQ